MAGNYGIFMKYQYSGHITMETFALEESDSSWIQNEVHEEPNETRSGWINLFKNVFQKIKY